MTIELNRKYLTVKDLIDVLSKVPPETEIEVDVDEGAGYYTCRSSFPKVGFQYYSSFGRSATLSLLVGDGHTDFKDDRIVEDDDEEG